MTFGGNGHGDNGWKRVTPLIFFSRLILVLCKESSCIER